MNTDDYLTQLRQKDRHIRRCIFVSKQAVLYKLIRKPTETLQGQWEKTEVDGMLFLVERDFYPFYALIVYNRASLDEFMKAITETTKCEVVQNFVYISQKPILHPRSMSTADEEERKAFRGDMDGGENENVAFWIPALAGASGSASQLYSKLSAVISYLDLYHPTLRGRLPITATLFDSEVETRRQDENKTEMKQGKSQKVSSTGVVSGSQSLLSNLLSGKAPLPEEAGVSLDAILSQSGQPEAVPSKSHSEEAPVQTGNLKKKAGKIPKISRAEFKDFIQDQLSNEDFLTKLYEVYVKNPKAFSV